MRVKSKEGERPQTTRAWNFAIDCFEKVYGRRPARNQLQEYARDAYSQGLGIEGVARRLGLPRKGKNRFIRSKLLAGQNLRGRKEAVRAFWDSNTPERENVFRKIHNPTSDARRRHPNRADAGKIPTGPARAANLAKGDATRQRIDAADKPGRRLKDTAQDAGVSIRYVSKRRGERERGER